MVASGSVVVDYLISLGVACSVLNRWESAAFAAWFLVDAASLVTIRNVQAELRTVASRPLIFSE